MSHVGMRAKPRYYAVCEAADHHKARIAAAALGMALGEFIRQAVTAKVEATCAEVARIARETGFGGR